MVGRLVEQQQIGFTGQCAANRSAPFLTAACGLGFAVQINAQLVRNGAHGIFGRAFFAVNGKIDEPLERCHIGVLFQHDDICAGNDNACAFVRLNRAGDQFHQRCLARAIAADQREPVACADKQVDILKQPAATLLQREIFKCEDWGLGHMRWRIGGRNGNDNVDVDD